MTTVNARDITKTVRVERYRLGVVLAVTALLSVLLSLFLARTIVRPMRQLARAAVRVAREGWLMAAVRLTWKPLLGAVACAVILGATLDHFLPEARSLPEAVRMLLKR
eukprot:gene32687-biopygen26955